MKRAGQVVLFRFPQSDLAEGKLRPAWQLIEGFDELIQETDKDFAASGLKVASIVRIGRLAAVQDEILLGAIGEIDGERLQRIKMRLKEWLVNA